MRTITLSDLSIPQRKALRALLEANGWTGLSQNDSQAARGLAEHGFAERREVAKGHCEWRITASGLALYAARDAAE